MTTLTEKDTGVSRQGELVIVPWLRARKRVAELNAELARAEHEEEACALTVAVWLMPEDMKVGEKVAVWYLDGLIQVEARPRPEPPVLTIRKRGREMEDVT